MTYAYIGLGANIGRPKRQIRTAIQRLAKVPGARLTAISPLYGSDPVGCPGKQRSYCNAVIELQTRLVPTRLHQQIKKIEQAVQRQRRISHAPRRLDADYLLHGDARLRSRFLTLPHPRMYQRAFVLQPFIDILTMTNKHHLQAEKARCALVRCCQQPLHRLCLSYSH